jgi:hypothetical protein
MSTFENKLKFGYLILVSADGSGLIIQKKILLCVLHPSILELHKVSHAEEAEELLEDIMDTYHTEGLRHIKGNSA